MKKHVRGAPSTSEEVLEELALTISPPESDSGVSWSTAKPPIPMKLPLMINPKPGASIRPSSGGNGDGRLSSTDPNLQNIPVCVRSSAAFCQALLRLRIIPPYLVDYSQIELRIMAHLSADSIAFTALAEGKDIHRATAAGSLRFADSASGNTHAEVRV
ncbi:DNA polymerase [Salmonella enterica]|uniref:DNA polymerase n=1 Tax=Salmonella enterica TaxID=28901 RepID=UPI0038577919